MQINKESSVSISLEENGSTLLRKGKYAAKYVNGKTIVETISEPVIGKSTKTLTLGYSFIEGALNLNKEGKSERPKRPHAKASRKEWDIWKGWNKISDKEKIRTALTDLAHDYNCQLLGFDILE